MSSRREMPIGVELISCFLLLLASGLVACSESPGPNSSEGPSDDLAQGSSLAEEATLHEILRHRGTLERAERVAQYLQRAEPEELDAMVYEFRIAPLDQGDIEYALFGSWWARFAPMAALAFAEDELRMEQPRVITEVLRTWAATDPEGLMAAGGFKGASSKMISFRPEMVDSVVVGWYESGKPGLADFIFRLPDDSSLESGLRAWVRMKVLAEGDEETLAWIDGVDYHEDIKRNLLIGALIVIAHQNPQLCVESFGKAKAAGIDVGTFVPRIANAWAHHDPEAALSWVLSFPEESIERFRAVNRIATKWRKRDALGLHEWLEAEDGSLDPKLIGLLRYASLGSLIKAEDYRPDWQLLMDRVGKIQDDNRRAKSALFILQHWYVADEAATTRWIEENPFGLPEPLLKRAPLLNDKQRIPMMRVLGLEWEEAAEPPPV